MNRLVGRKVCYKKYICIYKQHRHETLMHCCMAHINPQAFLVSGEVQTRLRLKSFKVCLCPLLNQSLGGRWIAKILSSRSTTAKCEHLSFAFHVQNAYRASTELITWGHFPHGPILLILIELLIA